MCSAPSSNTPRPSGSRIELKSLVLFEGISETTLESLTRQSQRLRLAKGEQLFSACDPSNAMYVVFSGRVRIWTVSAAGAEITLNVLTPGAIFGEIGLLDGSERTASASGMDASELLVINRRSFFDALRRDPELALNVIGFLCERLRWVSARMEDSALRTAPERLARILVHLCLDYGGETAQGVVLSINLTQGELARWAVMSRESLNKILGRWADEGLLTQSRNQITIHDRERLDEIAELGEEL